MKFHYFSLASHFAITLGNSLGKILVLVTIQLYSWFMRGLYQVSHDMIDSQNPKQPICVLLPRIIAPVRLHCNRTGGCFHRIIRT